MHKNSIRLLLRLYMCGVDDSMCVPLFVVSLDFDSSFQLYIHNLALCVVESRFNEALIKSQRSTTEWLKHVYLLHALVEILRNSQLHTFKMTMMLLVNMTFFYCIHANR